MNDPKKIFSSKWLIFFSLIYGSLIIFSVPNWGDALYYWEWSQHLAFGYYDGPPMIAYLLRGFTDLFGNSAFVLTLFSVVCNLVIGALIYLLALNLFDRRTASWSALLWLLIPQAFMQYVLALEYDTPATLFWMMTLFVFYLAHKHKSNFYLYLSGLFLGCTLLSKYMGVLLGVSLFSIVVCVKPYRYLLKNVHLYLAAFVALMVFSPVIIWNYQNGFDSFVYQLQHGFHHPFKFSGLWLYFLQTVVNYNIIFLFLLYFVARHYKSMVTDERLAFLFYPAAVSLLFFALAAPFQFSHNWNETFLMTSVILVVYFALQSSGSKRVLIATFYLYGFVLLLITAITVASGGLGFSENLSGLNVKRSILAIAPFYDNKKPVVASDWMSAAGLAYYLPGHPQIYSFSSEANQFRYWSQSMAQLIRQGKVTELFYVTRSPQVKLPFPMKCDLVKASHNSRPLYAYDCRA